MIKKLNLITFNIANKARVNLFINNKYRIISEEIVRVVRVYYYIRV